MNDKVTSSPPKSHTLGCHIWDRVIVFGVPPPDVIPCNRSSIFHSLCLFSPLTVWWLLSLLCYHGNLHETVGSHYIYSLSSFLKVKWICSVMVGMNMCLFCKFCYSDSEPNNSGQEWQEKHAHILSFQVQKYRYLWRTFNLPMSPYYQFWRIWIM